MRIGLTIFGVPYSSMGAELSADYDERIDFRSEMQPSHVDAQIIDGLAWSSVGIATIFGLAFL